MTTAAAQDDKRLEMAAQWWASFQEADPSPEDISAWLAWMEQDARNAESFRQIGELADRVRVTQVTAPERLAGFRSAAPVRSLSVTKKVRRHPAIKFESDDNGIAAAASPRFAVRKLAIAASMLIGIGGVLALAAVFKTSEVRGFFVANARQYMTPVAVQREVLLPDGSRVTLGGASRVETVFTNKQRLIRLTSGEAYFQVKHETPSRPFIVDVGLATVRAVGTAFNIRKNDMRVAVTVTEGKVKITRADTLLEALATGTGLRRSRTAAVASGEKVVVDSQSDRLRISLADPDSATAWRDGRLDFVDEPLDIVLDNVNRYSRKPIVSADPRLHDITYTGTFVPTNEDAWLNALEGVFDLKVVRESSRTTLHTRAQDD